jgi:hypothetical protein
MTSKAPQANASDNSASIMNRFGGIVTGGDNNEFNSEIMSQYGLTSVISGSFCSEMMVRTTYTNKLL